MAEQTRWIWPLYPLGRDSWGNQQWTDDGTPPGQTVDIRRAQGRGRITYLDTGETKPLGTMILRQRFYIPTDDDVALIQRRFPRDDPQRPAWHRIKAVLIAGGRDVATLDKSEAPVLLEMLGQLIQAKATTAPVDAGGDREPDAQADAKPAGTPGKGMTWQEAMKAAEDHCARNPFPGVNALAKIVRQASGRTCSTATIRKAIDRSAKLRAKLAEHEAQRKSVSAGAMTEGVAASARQTRERDPAEAASTDEIFRALVEQAKKKERASLNAMNDAQRRELVAAMDDDSIRKLFKPRTR